MSKSDEKSPSGMDISFIGKPHEWDPRRLYSQTGADWQYRVDFDRLRTERLARLREQMKADDLAALVLFAGANIRYATASYQGNWKYNINIRYAVLPANGEPVLFETAGSDLQCAKIDLPWMEDRIRPAITWQWAEGAVPYMAGRMAESVMDVLKEHKVEKERIGIDNLDMPALEAFQHAGLTVVNGWPTISKARTIKTRDEIELLKQASSIGDAAIWKIKYEWLKPGVRERDIEAKVHEFMLERGCEIIYDIIVASGGNTSPYRRWATDKLIRQGDLVIVDIHAVGPSGYCRVEEKRGGVQDRRRLKQAASFVVAFAEKPIAPFLLPAHRTGHDHFGHPALGRISHGGMRRTPTRKSVEGKNAQFPEHALCRELPEARAGDVMPAAEKATDRLVQIKLHRVPCVRNRAIGEVGRPSPHRAVQGSRHILPRRLITRPQPLADVFLDGGDGLLGRSRTVVASAGSR